MILLILTGCQSTHLAKPLDPQLAGNDPADQLEYWHHMTDEPVASNDQAFHGLLLYLENKDDAASYADRVQLMKSRKLLPTNFNEPADAPVTRGTLAVAILRAAKIKGGLNVLVLGPWPRYAVRELVFAGIYPPSSPNQTFTGNEFVGIIGKVEDYQRGDAANVSATELPEEMRSARQ